MDKPKPFNPLDKRNLGISVAEAMLESSVHELPPQPFKGAGIYAIYYSGNFSEYAEISRQNERGAFKLPIYIGKAVPAGARKGGGFEDYDGMALYNRLKEHAESIRQTSNLRIEDFKCRYLVADDIWIPLGETLLIQQFSPLWNHVLDGFGNHDPGSGRYGQKKSPWDILHPGRKWAENLKGEALGLEDVRKQIAEGLRRLADKADPGS